MQKRLDMIKKNLKIRVLLTMMTLATFVVVGGCSNEKPDRNITIGGDKTTSAPVEENDTAESFAFVHNNVKVTPNDLVDPLVKALGSDYSYFESPSCAYIGLDKCYVYKGFTIYTYPDSDAVDHVLQVVLTDETVSTPEGLTVGDAATKVVELYGNSYVESNGSYAYTSGKTSLMIIIQDDVVKSIQYSYTDSL